MCNCENYETSYVVGDGYLYYTFKCNECGKEWFEVYQLCFIETVDGNLEENEEYSV